jgi:putative nucleotidyltransferase with HDIG domain
MNRLRFLEQSVRNLYEAKDPKRTDWADWLYQRHVFVVAAHAKALAAGMGASVELAQVAAMLHDVADAKMKRWDPEHKAESLRMARRLMEAAGYARDEVKLVVDDAVRLHSCHDGQRPESLEGRVLATADALAHIKSDFYLVVIWMLANDGQSMEEIKAWVLKKLERDFGAKMLFEEVKREAEPDYRMLKELFLRVG